MRPGSVRRRRCHRHCQNHARPCPPGRQVLCLSTAWAKRTPSTTKTQGSHTSLRPGQLAASAEFPRPGFLRLPSACRGMQPSRMQCDFNLSTQQRQSNKQYCKIPCSHHTPARKRAQSGAADSPIAIVALDFTSSPMRQAEATPYPFPSAAGPDQLFWTPLRVPIIA